MRLADAACADVEPPEEELDRDPEEEGRRARHPGPGAGPPVPGARDGALRCRDLPPRTALRAQRGPPEGVAAVPERDAAPRGARARGARLARPRSRAHDAGTHGRAS